MQPDKSSSNSKLIDEFIKANHNNNNSSLATSNKENSIDNNLVDVGKSSSNHRYFTTSMPRNITNQKYLPREASLTNDLDKIKKEEPIFTNEKIYMQLIPEAKIELDHKAPSKVEFIELSAKNGTQSNASTLNSTWETNQFADLPDSLNTANSRSYPFRYQNPPKNRKYEPFNTNNNNKDTNYLDNEAVMNDYSKQKKKVYFTNNNNQNNYPKHQLDDVRRIPPHVQHQSPIVHNPNQRLNNNNNNKNNNYASNYTNNNREDYVINNYNNKPTKLEYEKVRTSLNSLLSGNNNNNGGVSGGVSSGNLALSDQNNEANRPREFFVKPQNTFYTTDPDPPAVQYNPSNKPIYKKPSQQQPPPSPSSVNTNLVQSEPVYVQDKPIEKPIYRKPKIPIYNLDQSQDSYAVKPKSYNNKPAYPPYEYHFHMPANKQTASADQYPKNLPKNEYYDNNHNRRQPVSQPTEEYAPPLPSPRPSYDIQTQGRSIGGSASTNPEIVKPTYLTGFTPVIAEHKYSRPVDEYTPPTYKQQQQPHLPQIHKLNKHQQQQQHQASNIYKDTTNGDGKYNIQLLNSGLISINELDNQIDRDKISNYPNRPYNNRAQSTNKLEQPQFVTAKDLERMNINPNYENLILPENKAYVYPTATNNKPENHITTNAYTATPSNDEVMYEKYKSMIRARLPSKNLVYRPYERLTAAPNYTYNLSSNNRDANNINNNNNNNINNNNNNNNNNNENELAPYNYPNSYHGPAQNTYHHGANNQLPSSNQLNVHSTNNEPYNNSQPADYLAYTPNTPKEATPIFFSKYNLPEHNYLNNKPILEDNDPDLYNPEGAVRYSIKRYLGRNLKNRRYFAKSNSKLIYPSTSNGGNYELIRPSRFSNGLINAKEENSIDNNNRLPKSNRLNLIEHNYLHNYATSASNNNNPTINKFKYNLKSILPRMDKSVALPYGGINIDALDNQKAKLQVQKIYIKDTVHHLKNPREIRELKYNPTANDQPINDQLLQLEALARQDGDRQNEILPFQPINKTTKVLFTGTNSNLTLRQIDAPIDQAALSLQEASTIYGSRILDNRNHQDKLYNLSTNYSSSEQQLNSTNKRIYKIKKMYMNRNLNNLNNQPNETEAEENRFKFIHVPTSIIDNKRENLNDNDEYKNEIKNENFHFNREYTLDSLNDQVSKSNNKIAKYEDNNLIELANQKQIVKVFPLGRVALSDNLNSDASNQLSTQYLKQTTVYPSTHNLSNHSSSSLASSITSTTSSIK